MRLFGLFGRKPEAPSPAGAVVAEDLSAPAYCARAQRLIDAGNLNGAHELLQRGVAAHPDSSEVKALHEQVQRHRLKEQVASLSASVKTRPDPAAFAALVDAHLANGDNIAARQTCTQGIERYPEDPELCFRMGRIWFDVFREGAIAKNAQLAVTYLRKCLEKDHRNRQAQEALIHLYSLVGARALVLKHLGGLLPTNEMRSLHDRVVQELAIPDDNLDDLLRGFERKREPGMGPTAAAPAEARPKRPVTKVMEDVLSALSNTKGHVASAIVAANGEVVHSSISNQVDVKTLAEVVETLSEVAKSCCARMGIGVFQEEEIQSPNGATFIKAVGDLTMFVMADKKAKAHEIAGHLARLSPAQ